MVDPHTTVSLGNGQDVGVYLLRFDKDGRLLSPQTAAHVASLAPHRSDVFVFSHGWNNTFKVALDKYVTFIEGYAAQRARLGIPTPPEYDPLLVGVIWPSTSFVFPWEKGPRIAGSGDPEGAEQEEMLRLLGEALDPEDYARFAELVDRPDGLGDADAETAAALVINGLRPEPDPDDASDPPTPEEFLEAWRALEQEGAPPPREDPDDFGGVDEQPHAEPDTGTPQAAGGSRLDPRGLLRTATVWLMKDRAGKVGAHGVAPLLEKVLTAPKPRLHLVGHSFGARVVLSAMTMQSAQRKAHSMLLLQPAVNRWCFADDVVGRGVPGGYRPVLDRVERPIITTFSRHDTPLHEAFHLAVRGSSLGEPRISAVGDTYRYGALGGYGPEGIAQLTERRAVAEGRSYDLDGVTGLVQLDGDVAGVKKAGVDGDPQDPAIDGHGDINSTVTWWALHSLTKAD